MKKRLVSLVIVVLFSVLFSGTARAEFWGSKNSNKYHKPSCTSAQNIKSNNLVKFNTPENAIQAGYIPCKVCKPPSVTKSENNIEGCFTIAKLDYDANDPSRSGCCSWHGGVCGCQNGRALCCDGTLSPSCGCN
jgi:hypothetical protein